MSQCVRPLSYLLALVLLGLPSCSKKEVAEAKNLASYTRDGQFRNCLLTKTTSTQAELDYLTLSLTTTPQPSSGPEVLTIKLLKLTGQPTSAYGFVSSGGMVYQTTQAQPVDYYLTNTYRAPTRSGGFSATFVGEARTATGPSTYTVAHLISGTLTNVQF